MSEMVPADQGRIRVVVIPDPVVATNFQFTQDIRTRWRVVCLKFQYVADANASNRIVSVGFTVAGTLAFSTPARVLIVALASSKEARQSLLQVEECKLDACRQSILLMVRQ